LPRLERLFVERIPDVIDSKTRGATINLSKFRNTLPNGLMKMFAISGQPCSRQPAIIARTNAIAI
jgi:hypothetical protein